MPDPVDRLEQWILSEWRRLMAEAAGTDEQDELLRLALLNVLGDSNAESRKPRGRWKRPLLLYLGLVAVTGAAVIPLSLIRVDRAELTIQLETQYVDLTLPQGLQRQLLFTASGVSAEQLNRVSAIDNPDARASDRGTLAAMLWGSEPKAITVLAGTQGKGARLAINARYPSMRFELSSTDGQSSNAGVEVLLNIGSPVTAHFSSFDGPTSQTKQLSGGERLEMFRSIPDDPVVIEAVPDGALQFSQIDVSGISFEQPDQSQILSARWWSGIRTGKIEVLNSGKTYQLYPGDRLVMSDLKLTRFDLSWSPVVEKELAVVAKDKPYPLRLVLTGSSSGIKAGAEGHEENLKPSLLTWLIHWDFGVTLWAGVSFLFGLLHVAWRMLQDDAK